MPNNQGKGWYWNAVLLAAFGRLKTLADGALRGAQPLFGGQRQHRGRFSICGARFLIQVPGIGWRRARVDAVVRQGSVS